MCSHWLRPPTSEVNTPVKGESLMRAGRCSFQRSAMPAIDPGFSVYVRISKYGSSFAGVKGGEKGNGSKMSEHITAIKSDVGGGQTLSLSTAARILLRYNEF